MLNVSELAVIVWVLKSFLGHLYSILFILNLLTHISIFPVFLKATCLNSFYLLKEDLVGHKHVQIVRLEVIIRTAKRLTIQLYSLLHAMHANVVPAWHRIWDAIKLSIEWLLTLGTRKLVLFVPIFLNIKL